MNIDGETLKKLKCANCNLYLSVGPVTINADNTFVCGRCLNEDAPVNTIYEALAQQFVFPCRYRSNGCKDTIKWGSVVGHEENCPKKPVNCPATLPCAWSGTVTYIAFHFRMDHLNDYISETNRVEINLDEEGMLCKVIKTRCKDYILDLKINKEEKLFLNLHQLIDLSKSEFKKHQYKLKFYTDESKKHLTLGPVEVEPYRPFIVSHIKNNVVDVSVLKFLNDAASSVFCEIVVDANIFDFKKMLTLLECAECKQFMCKPIHKCKLGHNFCGPCFNSLPRCSVCRWCWSNAPNARNDWLTDVATKVNGICKIKKE